MHLNALMPQNGRNKKFRENQATSKVPLMLLDVKMLKEWCGPRF